MRFSTEKVYLPLFVLVCFVFSLHCTYGKTSIIFKELVTPKLIASRDGTYAPTYRYGGPVPKYHIRESGGRTVRDIWKLRSRRENSAGNYANRFKTWSPYKDQIRFREPPIKDIKPLGKRRRPIPPHLLKHGENDIIYPRRPGRPHKKRFNNLQRPIPPADDDFDSEDYFPEESKRAESQYDYPRDGPRRPVKKRRNPAERKKKPKKPIPYQNPYDDDDRRVVFDDERKILFSEERPDGPRYKPKRQPTISYSTFIQHSPPVSEVDYDYADEEEVRPIQNQKKKRRIKKKTNKHKEEDEVEEYRPEKYSPAVNRYPPSYTLEDDYETQAVSKVKVKKYKPEPQPVYGDGHISHQTSGSVYGPVTSSNFFRTPAHEDYSQTQQNQKIHSFNQVPFQQTQTIVGSPQTQTIVGSPQNYRPSSYETNNFQSNSGFQSFSQPSGIQYNKITQPSQEYSNVFGYSNAHSNNYIPGSYSNSPVNSYDNLNPSTSSYLKYRNYQDQQQSQDSPVYYSPSLSYNKDVATSYKTSPIYDSTDTFASFNSPANGQKKYTTYSSKYSESNGGIIPSVKISEGPDNESEFLQKHQNLYNNGISGVPVQGDGYMNKESKKDYDIGYGEFQFDENPTR